MYRWFLISALTMLLGPIAARGAVVVFANQTDAPVAFTLATPDGKTRDCKIAPGDVAPIAIEGKIGIGYDAGGSESRHLLTPNAIYYFFRKERLDLVERCIVPTPADTKPSTDTVGGFPPDPILEFPVMLVVDEDEPTVQRIWEARFRKRLDEASDIFEQACRVRFKVVSVGTWESDNAVTDFSESMREFQRKVRLTPPARLAIGFTSQYNYRPKGREHLGGTRGPLYPYVLVREWSQHISASERLEVLVHELGHVFGASHSPDPNSVMRPVVGDRRSRAKDFRIGFDPVNTLLMYMFCEALRQRDARSIQQFPPTTRELLIAVYKEMAKELPEDNAAEQYLRFLGGDSSSRSAPPSPQTATPSPAMLPEIDNEASPLVAAALVVQAITNAAARNHNRDADTAKGAGGAPALAGDRLTEYYLRVAAMTLASRNLLPETAARAYLLALAIAVDDSAVLRDHRALGRIVRRIESESQREQRLAVLGNPTMHGRRDLAQHFVLSAGLASLVGVQGAETVGIAKELADSRGGSGFSFVDLAADMAGAIFAERLLQGRLAMADVGNGFTVADYLPERGDLVEGLTAAVFAERYGSPEDARFQAEKEKIRRRILTLSGYLDRRAK
jgi:hypothetical protein